MTDSEDQADRIERLEILVGEILAHADVDWERFSPTSKVMIAELMHDHEERTHPYRGYGTTSIGPIGGVGP